MKYAITRRDFLNGIAIGTGASLLAPAELFAQNPPGESSVYYPPTLTGLRGNHDGSYEVSHALAWGGQKPAEYRALEGKSSPWPTSTHRFERGGAGG